MSTHGCTYKIRCKSIYYYLYKIFLTISYPNYTKMISYSLLNWKIINFHISFIFLIFNFIKITWYFFYLIFLKSKKKKKPITDLLTPTSSLLIITPSQYYQISPLQYWSSLLLYCHYKNLFNIFPPPLLDWDWCLQNSINSHF